VVGKCQSTPTLTSLVIEVLSVDSREGQEYGSACRTLSARNSHCASLACNFKYCRTIKEGYPHITQIIKQNAGPRCFYLICVICVICGEYFRGPVPEARRPTQKEIVQSGQV